MLRGRAVIMYQDLLYELNDYLMTEVSKMLRAGEYRTKLVEKPGLAKLEIQPMDIYNNPYEHDPRLVVKAILTARNMKNMQMDLETRVYIVHDEILKTPDKWKDVAFAIAYGVEPTKLAKRLYA